MVLRSAWLSFLAAALCSTAAAQAFPRWTWATPSTTADKFGAAVAMVGDLNGDGFSEVVAGGPSYQNQFSPSVYTYAVVHSGADGTPVRAHLGGPMDSFGAAVAGAGDVDLDGIPDVIVAAPGQTAAGGWVGTVRVFSGATGAVVRTITGLVSGDDLGFAVAGGADFDLDGVPDVVASSPSWSFHAGKVEVFSGATGGLLKTLTVPAAAVPNRLGASVAIVGDLDFDGRPDVLAGAPGHTTPLNMANGTGYVFSYATGAVIHVLNGPAGGGRFGISATGLGDVDGDGVQDLAMGAPYAFVMGFPQVPGKVEVRSGLTGGILYTLNGTLNSDHFGTSIANGGDQDGDGRTELLVGAPNAAASGPQSGRVTAFSGPTGAAMVTFTGAASELMGTAVAGGADVDGNGVPDMVGGGAGVSFGPPGRVAVLSPVGYGPGLTQYGAACPGTGGFAPTIAGFGGPPTVGNAMFGISVARGRGAAPAYLFASTTSAPSGFPVGGGCSAWLGGAVFQVAPPIILTGVPGTGGAGYGTFFAPVPANPALSGTTFHLEWAMLDLSAPTGNVSLSDALTATIQ
jgi:hypothetical protein